MKAMRAARTAEAQEGFAVPPGPHEPNERMPAQRSSRETVAQANFCYDLIELRELTQRTTYIKTKRDDRADKQMLLGIKALVAVTGCFGTAVLMSLGKL